MFSQLKHLVIVDKPKYKADLSAEALGVVAIPRYKVYLSAEALGVCS